jgi:hypothetical protein
VVQKSFKIILFFLNFDELFKSFITECVHTQRDCKVWILFRSTEENSSVFSSGCSAHKLLFLFLVFYIALFRWIDITSRPRTTISLIIEKYACILKVSWSAPPLVTSSISFFLYYML